MIHLKLSTLIFATGHMSCHNQIISYSLLGAEQHFCAKRLGLENGAISDNQIE